MIIIMENGNEKVVIKSFGLETQADEKMVLRLVP